MLMLSYADTFIPVIPMEDDPLHTDTHPFCYDATCSCHKDDTLIAAVSQAVQDGLLTPQEETALAAQEAAVKEEAMRDQQDVSSPMTIRCVSAMPTQGISRQPISCRWITRKYETKSGVESASEHSRTAETRDNKTA